LLKFIEFFILFFDCLTFLGTVSLGIFRAKGAVRGILGRISLMRSVREASLGLGCLIGNCPI
jgi:hypothetical protein